MFDPVIPPNLGLSRVQTTTARVEWQMHEQTSCKAENKSDREHLPPFFGQFPRIYLARNWGASVTGALLVYLFNSAVNHC